ncbi:MAG: MBL fold metallo-hydrolase [Desulfuromonadaceae bacterium]|nr:MBL fold metallo-hydrolase [Desulfuromonadaceae bacterium]
MMVHTLSVGPLDVNCHVVACSRSREALVIDPGGDEKEIWKLLTAEKLNLRIVANTHGHFDHAGGNAWLVRQSGADLLIHRQDRKLLEAICSQGAMFGCRLEASPLPSRFLEDGEVLSVGDLKITVIHTPGHTPGGVSFLVDGHLFSGDTLFAGSVGRTDLPGGDFDALMASIRDRLLVLPDETIVHPGHGPDTTIGREKAHNPFLRSQEGYL